MAGAEVRALALGLALAALVAGRGWAASDDPPPAQLLLDLDLLSQTEPQSRDLLRRLSVVERLRLLELFRMLDARPVPPVEQPAADTGHR
jgi:hypothetical protein